MLAPEPPRKHPLRDICLVVGLLIFCTLFYYFGELVDVAGWTALRFKFFYTVHDLHRLLFLAPIIYAGYSFRIKGALAATITAFVIFLPRALLISTYPDPIVRVAAFIVTAGAIGCLTAITHDRTEQIARLLQQEEAVIRQLQTSEERYRQLFENAHDAIWISDIDGNIISANAAANRFEGFTIRDLSHTKPRPSLLPESLRTANEVRTKLLRGEPFPQPYEQKVITRQGAQAILKLTTNVVTIDGKPAGFQHIARDITQERQLENLLREERDKLFGILEMMKDGVAIISPEYRIRFANPTMISEFGEGIGRYCYEYLHNLDTPCEDICRLPSVTRGLTERWEYTRLDGRTYEVVASPFVDSDGKTCQLATLRNITHRKQAELELIKLNQLKSDLLSNISHEFKSPLTSIKGIISSLLQKDVTWDDKTREMLLKGMNEETDRLASLVTNLLNMSKIEAGVWTPEKASCHISDIITEAVEHQRWIHKNHIFQTSIEPVLPEIYADSIQIRQVLINLMENAASYSEEGARIIVAARLVDGQIEVRVSDQGVGIPLEELGKIFDKFYRGSQKRQKPGGTGLGLAICKAIVTDHGGCIWAESEMGHGTTFRFTLPIAPFEMNKG